MRCHWKAYEVHSPKILAFYLQVSNCVSLFKAFETLQQNVFSVMKIFVTKSLVFVSKDLLINKTHFVLETPSVKVLAAKNVITKSPICLKKKK